MNWLTRVLVRYCEPWLVSAIVNVLPFLLLFGVAAVAYKCQGGR